VDTVAKAEDMPALPGHGIWQRMPVSPALLRWTIRTLGGRHIAAGTVVDFRGTEPPRQDFCRVYAPGTVQNFAADAGIFNWGAAGRYLYKLTPSPFDTGSLANGRYSLTVTASDTAGNAGSRTVAIAVDNRVRPTGPRPASADWRCAGRLHNVDRIHALPAQPSRASDRERDRVARRRLVGSSGSRLSS
jgi:hypothetical protein